LAENWKKAILALSVTLAAVSWLSQTYSLLTLETSTLIGMVAAGLGAIFIGHSAFRALLEGNFGIDILATFAVVASIYVGEYVAAAVVVLMLGGGEILEDYTSGRASVAIEKLIEESPKTATIIREGREMEVSISEVRIGETVVVKPGGKIPVDGLVNAGRASVNQASITGESMPVERGVGEKVFGGTIIELGSLDVEVTAVGDESTYGKIIKMVEEAEEHKAPIERTADRYAKYFTPVILALGVVVYIFTGSLLRVAALWVIACPCSLTLATPMAVVASIGNSARKGILIRNGESLERLSNIDVLALDKTGTITTGHPEVVAIKGFNTEESMILSIAATAEKRSEHPLAHAILKKAEEDGIKTDDPQSLVMEPGLGVRAETKAGKILVGNEKLMARNGVELTKEALDYSSLVKSNRTLIYVARGGRLLGVIEVADTTRGDLGGTFKEAKRYVKRTIMLTGDNESVAKTIGEQVGVDEVFFNLLPEQKVEKIKALKAQGYKVAMIGDGVNDAPALATSDVGIAMGLRGTDVAIETAGVVLATDDLRRIPKLLRIGRSTMAVIKQNLVFAMAVNVIGIGLSVTGVIPPLVASIIHESNALIVMLNSLRLLRVD
jgi:heavy metal translocating P-type ATPase